MKHLFLRAEGKRTLALSAGALLGALLVLSPAGGATAGTPSAIGEVSVAVPASTTVGASIIATVTTSGAEDLYSYEVEVAYDPTALKLNLSSVTTPEGGFSRAEEAAASVTVVHSRLGTSPGLFGDITLASLQFETLTSGPAEVTVTALRSADSSSSPMETGQLPSTVVSVDAADTPNPESGDGPSPQPESTQSAVPSPSASSSNLAVTGSDGTPGLVAGAGALAAMAAGTVLVVSRRKALK